MAVYQYKSKWRDKNKWRDFPAKEQPDYLDRNDFTYVNKMKDCKYEVRIKPGT